MTSQQAAKILEQLIDELDFNEQDNPLLQPGVLVALHKAINALKTNPTRHDSKARTTSHSDFAHNAGKVWTADDDKLLLQMFEHTAPLHLICERLGRNPSGILARMVRLGCIEHRDDYRQARNRSLVVRDIWSEYDIRELKASYLQGMTTAQLAEKFDTSQKAIEARLFYMGLSTKAPDFHLKHSNK